MTPPPTIRTLACFGRSGTCIPYSEGMRKLVRALPLITALCALSVLSGPALAQQVPGGSGWTPGAGAALDDTYQGFIDQPRPGESVPLGASFVVKGWIVDMAAE